jgi:iron complex transport system substrate-binding protein
MRGAHFLRRRILLHLLVVARLDRRVGDLLLQIAADENLADGLALRLGHQLLHFRILGQAVGAADAGNQLADDTQARLDELAAQAASAATGPRLFYEIDVTNGIFTPPAESIYGEMFALAGATPISGNKGYSISLEDLVAADPEVILLGDAAYGVTAADVGKRSGWGGMTAVKNGAIFPIDDIVVTRPGPRLVDGLEALIAAIHPELATASPSPGPS